MRLWKNKDHILDMKYFCLLSVCFFASTAKAVELTSWQADVEQQLHQVVPNHKIQWQIQTDEQRNQAYIQCSENNLILHVKASVSEQPSTAYKLLRHAGFLYPHPRKTILPAQKQLLSQCGVQTQWHPRFVDRGWHLHTQHPNEWVDGFFSGESQIGLDLIHWLARNGQNVLQVQLLRTLQESHLKQVAELFQYAKNFQIKTVASVSFASQQQKSLHLLEPWRLLFGNPENNLERILARVQQLSSILQPNAFALELGTSEFTAVDYDENLTWINAIADILRKQDVAVYFKIHTSNNQHNPKYGNYNFLPARAKSSVGLLPHTVMFYSLQDEFAPMYGREDYKDMQDFILKNKDKHDVWYFPETSYFIGMDIDVPLYLLSYLRARTKDIRWLVENGITGHVNFSTGHELGYWLFDWHIALLTDSDFALEEGAALGLLGEDVQQWQQWLDWQNKHIKKQQLIQILSSSNLQDEISFQHSIHVRPLWRELAYNQNLLRTWIEKMDQALHEAPPDLNFIKDQELQLMMKITFNRLKAQHALAKSLLEKFSWRRSAIIRNEYDPVFQETQTLMHILREQYNRYPESMAFSRQKNLTSYDYGYAWVATELFFWQREKNMVLKQSYNPFYMNLYLPFEILF